MIEGSRNNTFDIRIFIITDHGKCFAGSSLAIGENGSIVPIQGILD